MVLTSKRMTWKSWLFASERCTYSFRNTMGEKILESVILKPIFFLLKSKFYKKRGATFFMTSHVSSALSTLPNIGQNHQVSSNLTSFWQFLCKEVVKKPITELMCDVIKKVAPRFLWNYDFNMMHFSHCPKNVLKTILKKRFWNCVLFRVSWL